MAINALNEAALQERLRLMTESRSFWRWAAVTLGAALTVAVGLAMKVGCW